MGLLTQGGEVAVAGEDGVGAAQGAREAAGAGGGAVAAAVGLLAEGDGVVEVEDQGAANTAPQEGVGGGEELLLENNGVVAPEAAAQGEAVGEGVGVEAVVAVDPEPLEPRHHLHHPDPRGGEPGVGADH